MHNTYAVHSETYKRLKISSMYMYISVDKTVSQYQETSKKCLLNYHNKYNPDLIKLLWIYWFVFVLWDRYIHLYMQLNEVLSTFVVQYLWYMSFYRTVLTLICI